MTDEGRDHHDSSKSTGATASHPSPTAAIFTVVLLSGLGAAGAAYGLGDLVGVGVGAVLAVAGAVVATFVASKSAPPDVKAIALLEAVTSENAPATPPSRFRSEPWASLYAQAVGNAEAQRTATLAVQEVENLRRELEQRDVAPAAFVPSPAHDEEDLVGAGAVADSSSEDRPFDSVGEDRPFEAPAALAPVYDRATALRELEEALHPIRVELTAIERELEPVVTSLQTDSATGSSGRDSLPAKMVDALVQTAADGIEDLAAGLMRASELAGVAERVTNRATLLALNAALEATRSGSEAFASIAEETRRLAEYAREATDTISRLSNEIEIKVGETISSIQSSSEDAKAAVASVGSGKGARSRGVSPETVTALHSLLGRVRALRERTASPDGSPVAVGVSETSESSGSPGAEAEQADVHVTYVEADERAATPVAGSPAAPADMHTPFGNIAFGGSESVPSGDAPDSDAPGGAAAESPLAEEAPAESPSSANEALPSSDAPGSPATSDPAALVLPKIPDWLEGIEPRHRS